MIRWIKNKGIKIAIDDSISEFMEEKVSSSYYASAPLRVLRKIINTNDIVLELGGGIGITATIIGKLGKRCISYEANEALIELANMTHAVNNVNSTMIHAIMGVEDGIENINIGKDFWDSSTILHEKLKNSKSIKVKSLDINSEISKYCPTMIYSNIEGGEAKIIQHIDFNSASSIKKLVISFHPKIISSNEISKTEKYIIDSGFTHNEEMSFGVHRYFYR